jgi:translation initiation factor IF-2
MCLLSRPLGPAVRFNRPGFKAPAGGGYPAGLLEPQVPGPGRLPGRVAAAGRTQRGTACPPSPSPYRSPRPASPADPGPRKTPARPPAPPAQTRGALYGLAAPATRCRLVAMAGYPARPHRRPPGAASRSSAPQSPRRPDLGLSQIKAASGLRSVARNNKATRLRTRPGRSTKSSAKDLSLRTVKLQSASRGAPLRGTPRRQPAVVRGRGLFVSDCGVQGRITPFRHGF